MAEPITGAKIFFLDPPTEQQWSQIQGVVEQEKWHLGHWTYFRIFSKLPYGKAVVCADDQGKYVGILVFAQPPSPWVSYVGMYIVSESCRGTGIGQRMWKLMTEHTDASRLLAIDSDSDMTKKYRAVYFPVPGPTWQKMSGPVAQLKESLEHAIERQDSRWEIVDPNSVINKVVELDSKIMHADRSQFIQEFFRVADGKAIVAEDGSVIAFGAILPTYLEATQVRIGPLYAENFNCALALLKALMRDVKKSEFIMTVPAETESGRMIINFLTEKANSSLGPLLARSYDRPYDCLIEWNNVFASSCHVASPLI